jgi:hypothetical protein
MKKLTLLFLLGLGFLLTSAQDRYDDNQISTIFPRSRSNGGYGAISFSYTQINGKDAFLIGGRGAWVIGHSFALGVGGNGFVNDVNYHDMHSEPLENSLTGGYGGIYLEPIIAPRFPVHLSFPVLIGAGGITNVTYNENWDNIIYDDSMTDAYMVIEPSAELEFNLTRHMRMALSCGYRFTTDIIIKDVSPDILRGFNYGLVLKFGKF